MQTISQTPSSVSTARRWTGRILSGITVLFMLFDATIHAMRPAAVVDAFAHLGYPVSVALPLAITVLIVIALYVFRRTSVLGAILLTGYLGGATASHVRVGDPLFNIIFPAIIATLAWAGLVLRNNELLEKIVDFSAPRPARQRELPGRL
ncbi:MAG: DoxX family protein [Bryobacterales bacterium]|nr:DoxX family protein [Bryobacterales bacterium]MBV9396509.1 DoxX family protein [Bryobacterales bacterium]